MGAAFARLRDVTLAVLPRLLPPDRWWDKAWSLIGARILHRPRADLPVEHEEIWKEALVTEVKLYSPAHIPVLVLKEGADTVQIAALAQDIALLEARAKPMAQDVYAAVRGWIVGVVRETSGPEEAEPVWRKALQLLEEEPGSTTCGMLHPLLVGLLTELDFEVAEDWGEPEECGWLVPELSPKVKEFVQDHVGSMLPRAAVAQTGPQTWTVQLVVEA